MRWYTAIGMKKDDADGRFCVWVDGEEKVLTEVTEARSNVAGLKVDKDVLNDPELFKKYQDGSIVWENGNNRIIDNKENYIAWR